MIQYVLYHLWIGNKVVQLEEMLTSPELLKRVCSRRYATRLVLYDFGSTPAGRKPDLLKHAQVLVNYLKQRDAKGGKQHQYTVQYVDGE